MNTLEQTERLKKTGRNAPCPCGSGKKYKKCHLAEDEAVQHTILEKAADERKGQIDMDEKADVEAKEKKRGQKRGMPQYAGKANAGIDRNVNIPRRGGI